MGMPPLLAGLAKGALGATPFGAMALGLASGLTGPGKGTRKRRRKARLTQTDMGELNQIKMILGKTAAANALPFYLGRGRG